MVYVFIEFIYSAGKVIYLHIQEFWDIPGRRNVFLFLWSQMHSINMGKAIVNSSVCNNKIFEILIEDIHLQFCAKATVLFYFAKKNRIGVLSVSVGLARQYYKARNTIEYLDGDKLLIRTTCKYLPQNNPRLFDEARQEKIRSRFIIPRE